jgi:hypothetical protein
MPDPDDERPNTERLVDVDLSHARVHAPDFEGARITDGWFRNANFSGNIEGLVINDVEVAPLVAAELDRRFPERMRLRPTDPLGFANAWDVIEEVWDTTVGRARQLPSRALDERVDDEWSFIETLRHLVHATDSWHRRMVLGMPAPYHEIGLAASGLGVSSDGELGTDPSATPSLDDVLAVRRGRMDDVAATMRALTAEELSRVCVPPNDLGWPREPHDVRSCLRVILNEEWEHSRYANRDLDVLTERNMAG